MRRNNKSEVAYLKHKQIEKDNWIGYAQLAVTIVTNRSAISTYAYTIYWNKRHVTCEVLNK
jgi:hypothetical protein